MFMSVRWAALALLAPLLAWGGDLGHPEGLGRAATPAEIAAWNIDVRPDFQGLPKGSGSVAAGEKLWEARCASCHGTFGESNEVFSPIVGGTTDDDIRTGHVAALRNNSQPERTTLMKVSTISTIWDYIHRAMPWTAPRSLKPDEVYAVTAYILNLGGIVPDDFVLSDKNIAEVQQRMPNRNGMTTDHGLWLASGKPDTHNTACMKHCPDAGVITSSLPLYARNTHGNLAAQNRIIGPVRGEDTTRPPLTGSVTQNAPAVRAAALATLAALTGAGTAQAAAVPAGRALAERNGCMNCHGVTQKKVGPAFADVAKKYHGDAQAAAALEKKIQQGGQGVWGSVPMPAQTQVTSNDLHEIVTWILNGAK